MKFRNKIAIFAIITVLLSSCSSPKTVTQQPGPKHLKTLLDFTKGYIEASQKSDYEEESVFASRVEAWNRPVNFISRIDNQGPLEFQYNAESRTLKIRPKTTSQYGLTFVQFDVKNNESANVWAIFGAAFGTAFSNAPYYGVAQSPDNERVLIDMESTSQNEVELPTDPGLAQKMIDSPASYFKVVVELTPLKFRDPILPDHRTAKSLAESGNADGIYFLKTSKLHASVYNKQDSSCLGQFVSNP